MKKLMTGVVALCALFIGGGSAFGSDCSVEPVKDTAWVYKWKFTGKTTKAVASSIKASACNAGQTCAVRCPASLKIEGYTWVCSPGCGDEFGQFAEANEVFWSSKPGKFSLAGGVQNEIMHIIDKKAKQAEVAGTAQLDGADRLYKFTYAGLGKYSTKKGYLTSASGNFAGTADPCTCAASGWWDCGTLSLTCEETQPTVVYGKWSVKLKKSASKKYARKGEIPNLPRWASMRNREEEEAGS